MSEQFSKVGDGLLVRAPGKVNLSLLVKGNRPDGFHNIETIMAKINWFDEILIEPGQKTGIELICQGQYKVPERKDNLVYKAAKLLFDTVGRTENVRLTLTKNVPAGAGLGSGSSDAAATLMGLNEHLGLKLGRNKLAKMAATLGSDVAFFLDGPIALCTARGEKVKKLPRCEFRALLILPDISVSTAEVYANYRHDSARYHRLHKQISEYIDKKRIDLVCQMCANMLQESCFELHTELATLKKKVESRWLRLVCLSGSGSTMFYIIDRNNEEKVSACRDTLEQDYGCRGIIVDNNSW